MAREPLDDGTVLYKGPCSHCGSSDARAHYDNGTSFCFSGNCRKEDKWQRDEEQEEGTTTTRSRRTETDIETEAFEFEKGEITAIEKRGLTEETCQKWKYQVNADKGFHVANYRDEQGELVAQKIRRAGKNFSSIGQKNKPLYGMWLWKRGGKRIVVTEGELDALSMSQAFDNKWPVVSLPDGAGPQSVKAIKEHYEYLCSFDVVVLMFDMDEPGRDTAEEIAALLPVGKAYIAQLPDGCKDANDTLRKKGKVALVDAQWKAREWRPDGIVSGEDISLDDLMTDEDKGYILRLPELQKKMLGLREAELTTITAGSGIGKSTTARQLVYELRQDYPNLKFGNIFLEERNRTTAQSFIALHNRIPLAKLRFNKSLLTRDQWAQSKAEVVDKAMWFYNHFGSLESERLLNKMRYMRTALGVNFIVLDHISIVTSGVESSSEGERKDIDILMTNLASLAQETGVGIIAIAHLKRVQGKVFNEGDQVSLSDLRGSASIEQLSHNVIALERNQQDEEGGQDTMRYRILKCREVGDLGLADTVEYNRNTGWLEPLQAVGL